MKKPCCAIGYIISVNIEAIYCLYNNTGLLLHTDDECGILQQNVEWIKAQSNLILRPSVFKDHLC